MCLLITVLGGLSVLRKDAETLALGPLRSMLRIVARYAKNPLSSGMTSTKGVGEGSDVDSEGGDSDDEGDGDQVGNYETEQLIGAVSKITDLLRKCWGKSIFYRYQCDVPKKCRLLKGFMCSAIRILKDWFSH